MPEFLMMNDSKRLIYYKETTPTAEPSTEPSTEPSAEPSGRMASFLLLKTASIMPETDVGEAKFLISVMIDTDADSSYEDSTLKIKKIRVDM